MVGTSNDEAYIERLQHISVKYVIEILFAEQRKKFVLDLEAA